MTAPTGELACEQAAVDAMYRRLDGLRARTSREALSAAASSLPHSDRLVALTARRAKGLEFDTVIVLGPDEIRAS